MRSLSFMYSSFPIRPGDKSPPVQAIFILSQVSNSSLTHIRNMRSSEKNESQTLLKDCGFLTACFLFCLQTCLHWVPETLV